MAVELDHVFVMCEAGAPEGEALVRAGLREGSCNSHPGQGTANRRFFFANAYLELVFVTDAQEAQSEAARPTRLWDRWVGRAGDCCPFGIVLRPSGAPPSASPFPTWAYHPAYLPPDWAIDIAVGTPLTEPEYFYLGFAGGAYRGTPQPTDHAIAAGAIESLRLDVPVSAPLSAPARAIQEAGIASFTTARPSLLEIVFDKSGQTVLDFRPELPLALRF